MTWIWWALLSAFFAGLTAILAKKGVQGLDANVAMAIRTSVVFVFAWGVAVFSRRKLGLADIPVHGWLFLILSGVATGLSWLCYFRALQLGDVSKVAAVDKLGVVFAIVLAVLFLREPAGFATLAGALMIVGGALLLAFTR